MIKWLICITFVLILCPTLVEGQVVGGRPDGINGSVVLQDTTTNENDTLINKNGFLSLFKGKPGKAALYSLIIPSGGQIYNKKWWKVPIALAIDGTLTYVLVSNRKSYRDAQNTYQTALALPVQPPDIGRLKERRDFFRKWSEYSWIWIIAGHLFTVVDAYVDRHLMDFDVSQDISVSPYSQTGWSSNLMAKAGVRINLNTYRKTTPNPLFISQP
ncbi:MAG: hypothetical protein IPL08_10910 [Saprospiraceae bacterium]|nr:hypothetical protein [Saprospiraceae bacterium]MBK8670055.1 hypothetical protein [Saprospiraceae bacterium]MBL0101504.1 hypothetical protein [Saprospiraceae bacterium]